MESSIRFNHEDMDGQIAEAIEEHEQVVRPLRPGGIGSVVCKPTLYYQDLPPDDAA